MNLEPLLQTGLGGLLAIIGGVWAHWQSHRQERKNLAHALAGEISAILDIVDRRQYEKGIREIIQSAQKTGVPWRYTIVIRSNYFPVFEANAAKIGLLRSDLAKDVAKLYVLCKGIVDDVSPDSFESKTPQESIGRLENLLILFGEARTTGRSLITRLEKL